MCAFFLLYQEIVLLLLRYDAHAKIINGTGRIPKDVTDDDEIHTMLEGMTSVQGSPPPPPLFFFYKFRI